ncbi:phage tail protein [Nocardioides marmoriginsengisoli]|uniref:Phage tail protein n=1 Tax=Nocardioides marmoriginsengisoli TaxID=661483 RepID=A0A3N0CIM6_9ACTN|nr:tail fiber protein [Nocardioides marmoriginsengisoli]RNL63294.1 phage tail protein [Nocardioides marmoriginsengisoli]
MTAPYAGEIRPWTGTFAPRDWMFCDGRLVPISEYELLFNLIGTTYGGDGQSTFQLPNLCGRVPIHMTNGMIGMTGGSETVTLTRDQLPTHTHLMVGSADPATNSVMQGRIPGSLPSAGTTSAYGSDEPFRAIAASSIAPNGGGEAHSNMQPYLTISYIISMLGEYPYPGEGEDR